MRHSRPPPKEQNAPKDQIIQWKWKLDTTQRGSKS